MEFPVLAPRGAEEQRRPAVARFFCQGPDALLYGVQEGGLEHQVLGRIAGHRQLAHRHQVGVPGLGAGGLDEPHVAIHVADGRVDLSEGYV